MSRSLKICAQVESGTIDAGYSAVVPNRTHMAKQFSLIKDILDNLRKQLH